MIFDIGIVDYTIANFPLILKKVEVAVELLIIMIIAILVTQIFLLKRNCL